MASEERSESGFTISQSHRDGVPVVRVDGELDMLGCPKLERTLEGMTDLSGEIVLDMRGLEFIDSSGIRCIFEHGRARRALHGGSLVCLVSAGGPVHRVIEITGLAQELDVRQG